MKLSDIDWLKIPSFAALLLMYGLANSAEPIGPLIGFDSYVKEALLDWQTPGLAVVIIQARGGKDFAA